MGEDPKLRVGKQIKTTRVKCFFKGCNEVVEVFLYTGKVVYCSKHSKRLAEGLRRMRELQKRSDDEC